MRRVSAGGDPNATTKPMPEPIQTRRPRHKVGHGVEKGEGGGYGAGRGRRGCGVGQLSRRLKLAVKLWQTATEKDEENCNRRKQQRGAGEKRGRQAAGGEGEWKNYD